MQIATILVCFLLNTVYPTNRKQISFLLADGCDVDPDGLIFSQEEDTHSPIESWGWKWTKDVTIVPNNVGWPSYNYMPDGHISGLKTMVSDRIAWYMFYPNGGSYRTIGQSPLSEATEELDPSNVIIGNSNGRVPEDIYDNGGDWLMGIYPVGRDFESQTLIGFVHAEDHFYDPETGFPGHEAYKSIALACSNDMGATWTKKGQILTQGEKPLEPTWSGCGDFDSVWDWQEKRWFISPAHDISGAVSYDKTGAAEAWKKWDGMNFTRSNFIDKFEPFQDSDGEVMHGSHPSILWNRYLQQWLMAWRGNDGNIYITSANKLPYWKPSRILLPKTEENNWGYPTLMSEEFGDRVAKEDIHIYMRQQFEDHTEFATASIQLCDVVNDC